MTNVGLAFLQLSRFGFSTFVCGGSYVYLIYWMLMNMELKLIK